MATLFQISTRRKGGMRVLIEIMSPITVDGVPVVESFRLNIIHKQRQARCKIQFPADSKPSSIDFVVYQYSMPRINGLSVSISFRGAEMETNKSFEAKASFDIIKRIWKVNGTFGNKTLNFECKEPLEMIDMIKLLVSSS